MSDLRRATPVLLVAPSAIAGGAERALAGLVHRLPDHGYAPHVALFERGPLQGWLDEAGCPWQLVPFGRMRHPWDVARTVRSLRHAARRTGARAVLSNTNVGQVYGGIAAATLRLPAVWWQQTIPGRRYGGPLMTRPVLDRLAARLPAAIVITSSREAAAAQRALTPRRRVEVVPLGVDLERVRAGSGRGAQLRALEGMGGGPLVGMAGWIWPWKGQDVFLRAAAIVARTHPGTRFVLVGGIGDETFRDELGHLVAELDLAGRVTFAGDRTDVYDWFDAMDVAVHASFGEAFGLVLVEAMALGTPVVATSAGGPSEIVVDGESGCLVPPGDHEAMAAAIGSLLDDPARRAVIGAAGRTRADRFSDHRMAGDVARLLDDLLRRRHLPTARS